MAKFIANLLFVLILFVLATALPLSTDIFSINLSPPAIDTTDEAPQQIANTFSLTAKVETDQPQTILLEIEGNENLLDSSYLDVYEVLIEGNKGFQFRSSLRDLSSDALRSQSDNTMALNAAALLIDAPKDFYKVSFHVLDGHSNTSVQTTEAIWIDHVQLQGTYIGDDPSLPPGRMLMKLYLPNYNRTGLIPITRHLNPLDNRWRVLYNALTERAPEGLGLYEAAPPIPQSPSIRITNQIAHVNWYSNSVEIYEPHVPLIQQAVAQSMFEFNFLEGVTFLYNESQASSFGNVDWSTIYRPNSDARAYMVYNHDSERLLLMPHRLEGSSEDTISKQVEGIWSLLTFSQGDVRYPDYWHQLIPPTVILNDATIDGELLTLDFNDALNHYLETHTHFNELLVDQLVQSFSSIDGIRQVLITVNGETPVFPRLANPLSPKSSINFIQ